MKTAKRESPPRLESSLVTRLRAEIAELRLLLATGASTRHNHSACSSTLAPLSIDGCNVSSLPSPRSTCSQVTTPDVADVAARTTSSSPDSRCSTPQSRAHSAIAHNAAQSEQRSSLEAGHAHEAVEQLRQGFRDRAEKLGLCCRCLHAAQSTPAEARPAMISTDGEDNLEVMHDVEALCRQLTALQEDMLKNVDASELTHLVDCLVPERPLLHLTVAQMHARLLRKSVAATSATCKGSRSLRCQILEI